ncbi:hypothetical protein Tco_0847027, partial [Tanacetum coccineum]
VAVVKLGGGWRRWRWVVVLVAVMVVMSKFEHREIGPLAQQSSSSPRAQNSKLEREIEERVRLQVTELEEMDYLNMAHMAFSQHFFSESSSVALAFLGMVTWEAKRDFILKAYKFEEYKEEYKEEMRMMMYFRHYTFVVSEMNVSLVSVKVFVRSFLNVAILWYWWCGGMVVVVVVVAAGGGVVAAVVVVGGGDGGGFGGWRCPKYSHTFATTTTTTSLVVAVWWRGSGGGGGRWWRGGCGGGSGCGAPTTFSLGLVAWWEVAVGGVGSLKTFKKRSPKVLKPRSKDTRRTSGNTARNDPFPPFLIIEAQTSCLVFAECGKSVIGQGQNKPTSDHTCIQDDGESKSEATRRDPRKPLKLMD